MTVDEPDLVGRTSAALVDLGVPRVQRLDALHLLAVLDASVGLDGRVRRPLDDLADEFELPVADVLRSLDHLERAGAIERDASGVRLLGRDDDGVGGLHLADFLEDVRAALDDPRPARPSVWPVRVGAGMLAAAAAVTVLLLAPVQQQPALTPTAAGSSTATSSGTTSDEPTEAAPREAPAPSPGPAAGGLPAAEAEGALAAATCPVGAPTIRAAGTAVEITNPTDTAVVVTAVTVAGTPVAIEPVTVGAGETVRHDLAVAPGLDGAPPTIDEWHWVAGTVDPGCA